MRQVTIAGVEDVSLVNQQLRYIHSNLVYINKTFKDDTLSSDNVFQIVRVCLIDIQHSAKKVLQQEGITEEILEKYSVRELIALKHLILVPHGNVPSTVTINTFRETTFEDLYAVYAETYAKRPDDFKFAREARLALEAKLAKEAEVTENETV